MNKAKQLQEKITEADALLAEMEATPEANTTENNEKYDGLIKEVRELKTSIENDATLTGAKDFLQTPAHPSKTAGLTVRGGDGASAEPFARALTLGEILIESQSYKNAVAAEMPRGTHVVAEQKGFLRFNRPGETKATLTSAGLTSIQRVPGMVEIGLPRMTVADLLASGETSSSSIRYMQETTTLAQIGGAATVAEGAAKPEVTLSYVEKDAPVKKIAAIAKVTDELFADYPAMRDYVNNRLIYMVDYREEAQLLNGDGLGANILGILPTPGIQTQAAVAGKPDQSILKAANKVRINGFLDPDAVVINPLDWELIQLMQNLQGNYVAGGPFAGVCCNGVYNAYMPIWGLNVVVTPAMAQGTALVGAFKTAAQVFYREGITVDSTNSNVDDFEKNLITVRAEERLALAVYRPLGFCKITTITELLDSEGAGRKGK